MQEVEADAQHDADKQALGHATAAQGAEGEWQGAECQHQHVHRIKRARPPGFVELAGILVIALEIGDVARERSQVEVVEFDDAQCQQVRVESRWPIHPGCFGAGGRGFAEHRAPEVEQCPLAEAMLRTRGHRKGHQAALLIELEHAHAIEIDHRPFAGFACAAAACIDHGFTITRPHAAALGQGDVLGLGTQRQRLGAAISPGRQGFTEHGHAECQRKQGDHDRHANAQFGQSCSAQRGQLAGPGQAAEAEQASDQRGITEHFVEPSRNRQQCVADRLGHGVAPLADIVELAHENGEGIEGNQHEPG